MKGIGDEPIFQVSVIKAGNRMDKNDITKVLQDNNNKKGDLNQKATKDGDEEQKKKENVEDFIGNVIDTDSEHESSETHRAADSQRALNYQQDQNLIEEEENEEYENESNKSDQIDDGTMNVFGFNDDLNLDDRVIVQNATDNQIYSVVERPKYLLQFE